MKETKFLNWVQLKEPIVVQINGTSGDGVILKPINPEEEVMDPAKRPPSRYFCPHRHIKRTLKRGIHDQRLIHI